MDDGWLEMVHMRFVYVAPLLGKSAHVVFELSETYSFFALNSPTSIVGWNTIESFYTVSTHTSELSTLETSWYLSVSTLLAEGLTPLCAKTPAGKTMVDIQDSLLYVYAIDTCVATCTMFYMNLSTCIQSNIENDHRPTNWIYMCARCTSLCLFKSNLTNGYQYVKYDNEYSSTCTFVVWFPWG